MNKSVARLGVGGPVGSGKTALLECLVPLLMKQGIEVAVVTNDLLTQEDADRLKSLPPLFQSLASHFPHRRIAIW